MQILETVNADFRVASGFWENFVEQYWEKKPVVLKQPFGNPPLTSTEIFEATVAASDQFRAGRPGVPLRLFIERSRLSQDLGLHFPEASDGSLSHYTERLQARLGEQRFMFVLNNLQVYSYHLWAKMRNFLNGLYELTGVPSGAVDTDVFIGNYKRTAAGIHKDAAGTFTFVVEGRKRMVVWPYEFFQERLGNKDYRKHYFQFDGLDHDCFRDQATVLEGEPGDVLYWPSTYWHVGESDEPLHVSLNLSFYFPWQPLKFIGSTVNKLVESSLGTAAWAEMYSFNPKNIKETAQALPQEITLAMDALKQASSHPLFQKTAQLSWVSRVTGFGFSEVPPPLPLKALVESDIIQADPNYPIVWIPCSDYEMICSANGHSFTVPAHSNIAALIDLLNTGAKLRVKNLQDEFSGMTTDQQVEFELSGEDICILLARFYSWRALTVVSNYST